ncbi:hypothetical protein DITRI_Ditri13aG0082800 [Diplodiscus trichospermus]
MDSSMCSLAPDPEMWIIQGTLAWRTSPVRTGIQLSIHSWDLGGPGGTTTAPLFSIIHTSLISVWTAISRA